MAEFSANTLQTVLTGQNVLFQDIIIESCNPSIVHRPQSGLVQLRGLTNQCRARFIVMFSANIAIPATGDTTAPLNLAIAINGEVVPTSTMISTPAAANQFNNVFGFLYIDVPRGDNYTISIKNPAQGVDVQNANLYVGRVA